MLTLQQQQQQGTENTSDEEEEDDDDDLLYTVLQHMATYHRRHGLPPSEVLLRGAERVAGRMGGCVWGEGGGGEEGVEGGG